MEQKNNHTILAFVGMPGAGKSEATKYLHSKGLPFARFGNATDEGLKKMGVPPTPENEQMFREKIRKELGMEAYAKLSEPKIRELLANNAVIVIDGLYSWEEYVYLKEKFSELVLIHIYAEPKIRYERLAKREIRPFSKEAALLRDKAEIEKLHKGGPIAIADYLIDDDGDIAALPEKIDALLARLGISL